MTDNPCALQEMEEDREREETHTSQKKTISPSNSTDEMHFLYLKTPLLNEFPLQKTVCQAPEVTQLVCI